MPAEEAYLKPYYCQDRPHPNDSDPLVIQDGWRFIRSDETGLDTLEPVIEFHKTQWAEVPCGHTDRRTDLKCRRCKWRLK